MKKIYFVSICLFISLVTFAGEVSEQQALQKAQQFMQGKQFKPGNLRRAASSANNAYYVFNAENNGGFVIVAGDDRMPEILGYSDKGNIDMQHLPCNFQMLLNSYAKAVDSLDYYHVTNPYTNRRTASRTNIEPLIKTHWGQGAPYNNYCPEVNGQRCLTGCVATAMAQIINYKQWPKSQTATVESYTTEDGINMPALEPTSFDWSNMTDDAVARLMLYCGQSVKMNYGPTASGAYDYIGRPLKEVFGYGQRVTDFNGYVFVDLMEDIVYQELSENRPVYYTGHNSSDGHAFVVDGYKDGLFHINWGWNGDADGYFQITATTEDLMPYPNSYWTQPTIGIDAPSTSADQAEVIAYNEMTGGDRVTYRNSASDDFLFPIYPYVFLLSDFEIENTYVGFGLYKDNQLLKVLASKKAFSQMIGYGDYAYFSKDIPLGVYSLCLIYRHNESEEWKKAVNSNLYYMIVHVEEKELYVKNPVKEWDGDFQSYGAHEINGVTYGLKKEFVNWATVLPYQLTEKYSGDIVIPNEVEYDGKKFRVRSAFEGVFENCKELKTISSAMEENLVIMNCPNLTKIDIKQGTSARIGNCPMIESLVFPQTVDYPSIRDCHNLKTIRIENSLIYSPGNDWDDNSLPALTDVYFPNAKNPQGGKDNIAAHSKAVLHVPLGCLEKYKSSQWKEWNIVDDMKAPFVTWGYCHDDKREPYGFVSNFGDIDHELAMRVDPEDLKAYKGSKITHIQIYSNSRATNDWGYENYEYVFITKRGTDYIVKQPFEVVRGAWNTIKLDEPYTITGEELFIGFGKHGAIGVSFSDMTYVRDAVWGRFMGNGANESNRPIGVWAFPGPCPRVKELYAHPMPLRFAIEGDNIPEGVVIREIDLADAVYEETYGARPMQRTSASDDKIELKGVIRNRSLDVVKSYTVEWAVDGGEKHSKTYETTLLPNDTETIEIEIPKITVNGKHIVTTDVTMVNEKDNKLEGVNIPTLELTITDGYSLGDVNSDNLVNVTDIVATVNYIMEKNPANFNKAAADLNGDGNINVTDIVKMVSIIMASEAREME
jgi:hypothetical protein